MAPNKLLMTLAAPLKRLTTALLKRLTTVYFIGTLWYKESSKFPNRDKNYKHSQKDNRHDNLIRPNWFELPDDNLEEILIKIDTYKDYMSFIAVCKSWRSIAYNMNYHFLPKKGALPMLLQPCGEGDDVHYLYSITKQKVYGGLHVPELSNRWTPGSSNGWLVTIDMNDLQINLLNPLTRVQIPLPPISTFQKPIYPHKHGDTNDFKFVKRVFISSDPVADQANCLLVAMVSSIRTLSFCKIGDHQWQKLQPSIHGIKDLIMYKGLLYAVDWCGKIFAIEINPCINVTVIAKLEGYDGNELYLVESSCDLLLVVRIQEGFKNITKTTSFKVFKLVNTQYDYGHQHYKTEDGTIHYQEEAIRSTWKEIHNLNGQMLFVGYNGLKVFNPCLYPGSKKDCIYFADGIKEFDICRLKGIYKEPHDIGLYDMKFQKIESLLGLDKSSSKMSSIWLCPNPW